MKTINKIFVVVFAILIAMPLIFSDKVGGKVSTNENRQLSYFPSLVDENGNLSFKGFPSAFEQWINDNVGFREGIVKLDSYIDYHVFNTASNDRIRIGKDGYNFYAWDNNLDIPKGTYPINDAVLEKIKVNQERIQRALKAKGIEYVLVLTPSKASIYPEKIKGANFEVTRTPIDIVADYLKENTTILVINTKEALLQAKDEKNVYFKTDTHWNEEGAYEVYKQIINELNEKQIISSKPVQVDLVEGTYKGEISAMLGNYNLFDAEKINKTVIRNAKAVNVDNPNLMGLADTVQVGHNLLPGRHYFAKNDSINEKDVLIYGDSFFGSWNINQLLSENFSKLSFIWSDYIKNEIVDTVKPKILVFERTERFINTLAQDCDPRLFAAPLEVGDNQFIDVPDEFDFNSTVVVVKNLSSSYWSEDTMTRLGILPNGNDEGVRVNIEPDRQIMPGESYSFNVTDLERFKDRCSFVDIQMVEEGVKYFGPKLRISLDNGKVTTEEIK